jgi:hypothetical protein
MGVRAILTAAALTQPGHKHNFQEKNLVGSRGQGDGRRIHRETAAA